MNTVLNQDASGGLEEIRLNHPPGTFAPTPASLISVYAIGKNRELLSGKGLDWGSGVGCLAIAAAKLPTVENVIGLEIIPANVAVAAENAARNGVAAKVEFLLSNSFRPVSAQDQEKLRAFRGGIDFLLANPPASDTGDGFEYRRVVLNGAREYLRPGGSAWLSISSQYGERRIRQLERDAPGFKYRRLLATTDWVPFDLQRPDLLSCLHLYAAAERSGGLPYAFLVPGDSEQGVRTAQDALQLFQRTGRSPLSRWQTHLFDYLPA